MVENVVLVEIDRPKMSHSHLREVLIFCVHLKKTAADAHRMLSSTYGEATLSDRMCRE